MKAKKVVSHLLVLRISDQVRYWRRDNAGWTEDLAEARRYARANSAQIARVTILKRGISADHVKPEAIEEDF